MSTAAIPFRPHPLFRSGHLQTIIGTILPSPPVPYRAVQHRVAVSDGDALVLHDDRPAGWSVGDPSLVLVHGLCGCHASSYMVRLADRFTAAGTRVFRMDMRGCGAGASLARSVMHAGRSEDLVRALEYVARVTVAGPVGAIGVSMGGGMLLKTLGELGRNQIVTSLDTDRLGRMAVVAPPVDLSRCANNLDRLSLRPYGRYFIRQLLRRVPPAVRASEAWRRLQQQRPPRTMRQFDSQITAPLCGFDGAEDYYRRASSRWLVDAIRVPTLVLAAADDPLIPIDSIEKSDWPEHVTVHVTSGGGHVGYIGLGRHRWMDHLLANWFA